MKKTSEKETWKQRRRQRKIKKEWSRCESKEYISEEKWAYEATKSLKESYKGKKKRKKRWKDEISKKKSKRKSVEKMKTNKEIDESIEDKWKIGMK